MNKPYLCQFFISHNEIIYVVKIQWKYFQSNEMYFYQFFQTVIFDEINRILY